MRQLHRPITPGAGGRGYSPISLEIIIPAPKLRKPGQKKPLTRGGVANAIPRVPNGSN